MKPSGRHLHPLEPLDVVSLPFLLGLLLIFLVLAMAVAYESF